MTGGPEGAARGFCLTPALRLWSVTFSQGGQGAVGGEEEPAAASGLWTDGEPGAYLLGLGQVEGH